MLINYRPTTCLPTIYKTITSVTSKLIQNYIDDRHLMPTEQQGCYRGSKGCKYQLLIPKEILQDCKSRKKNVCMAYIDYSKAFDSVPHSWIINHILRVNRDL
jgi:hypothetical protein